LREYYHANREKYFEHQLQRNYGIGITEFVVMLEAQGHKCWICRSDFGYSKATNGPCVDHCHTTGRVRGLLCGGCNTGIGLLNEDPTAFTRAIAYLDAKRFEDGTSAV
jgi:hypothetical protein